MARDQVTTVGIADANITTAKIANNAVDETKFKDALVGDFSEVVVTASDSILLGDNTDSGNTKRDTVQGVLDLVPAAALGESYESSETTVTADTAHTFAHGLSSKPKSMYVALICKTADIGFSVGDELDGATTIGAATSVGVSVTSDTTNIVATVATALLVIRKDNFNPGTPTLTSWKLIVRAYA